MRAAHVVLVAAAALSGGFLLARLSGAASRPAVPTAEVAMPAPGPTSADEQLRLVVREELARVRGQVAPSCEIASLAAPMRAADDAAKATAAVAPEVEAKRAAAYVEVSDLLAERLPARKWRREDELRWRQQSVDLSSDQYAELRYRLLNAMNSGDLDSSELDDMH
jgi:hypothetical protein